MKTRWVVSDLSTFIWYSKISVYVIFHISQIVRVVLVFKMLLEVSTACMIILLLALVSLRKKKSVLGNVTVVPYFCHTTMRPQVFQNTSISGVPSIILS